MRHKRLGLIALLLLGLTGLKAQTIYVKEKSGTQTAYMLSNITKMTFSSGSITVSKTTDSPSTYSLNGLRYLNFKDLTTSIVAVDKKNIAMLLFPNPVVDVLNIQLSVEQRQAHVVEIFSVEGRVVYQEKLNQQSDVYKINVSALSKGLYVCRLSNGISTQTTKFLKQ